MAEIVLNHEELSKRIDALKARGKKIVLANGCFDLLNVGHARYLSAAKALGDVLVLALSSDDSVKRLKGPQRPLLPLQDRLGILSAFKMVDFVTAFEGDTAGLLSKLKPHLYAQRAGGAAQKGAFFGGQVAPVGEGEEHEEGLIQEILRKFGSKTGGPSPANLPNHILVARTNKVGDLLLSLPVFQALKKTFPNARLTALVSPYAKEIVQNHPAVDAVELLEPLEGLFSLAGRFRRLAPDAFIALYPRPRQVLAAFLAGIPVRIGTAYRWYSLFLNRRVKVHRSVCDRHEVEYNMDLAKPLGVTEPAPKIQFIVKESERAFARDLLREKGIAPGTRYVAVHPGHKGSALNWKPESYARLINRLCQRTNPRVVITGGPDETALVSRVTAFLSSIPQDHKPVLLIGECTLRQLAAVYAGADCFISGSTGTMHLAAAMGTPTVSLFCPIPETTPVRWGPWGNESTVLMPENLKCGDCRVGRCRSHDPMEAIPEEEVFQAVEKYLQKGRA